MADASNEKAIGAGYQEAHGAEAQDHHQRRLWEHKRDILVVVLVQTAIAIAFVPAVYGASMFHPAFALSVSFLLIVPLIGIIKLLSFALNNLVSVAARPPEQNEL